MAVKTFWALSDLGALIAGLSAGHVSDSLEGPCRKKCSKSMSEKSLDKSEKTRLYLCVKSGMWIMRASIASRVAHEWLAAAHRLN